jgi:hypothetical protein
VYSQVRAISLAITALRRISERTGRECPRPVTVPLESTWQYHARTTEVANDKGRCPSHLLVALRLGPVPVLGCWI